MAILGFQLVSTLVGISLLSKFATHFSFTRFFLCSGVYRCLLPTDKEILESAGLTKLKSKGKKHRGGFAGAGSNTNSASLSAHVDKFHFPRATPLKLRLAAVHLVELACLPLYSELVWLLDFSACALVVFLINELVLGLRQVSMSYNATVTRNNSDGGSGFFLVHSFFAPSTINRRRW
ncbi:hypothetical protein SprV_0301117000 [Sparganum proliferum]